MKKNYKKMLSVSLGLSICLGALAQSQTMPALNSAAYQQMKLAGTLPNVIHQSMNTSKSINSATSQIASVTSTNTPGNCACIVNIDSAFADVPFTNSTPPFYSNDDGSSPLISLPFTFCYYGDTVNSVYINNNGNISFNSPYSTFTAAGFPSTLYNMIAPFWADVDTRGGSGSQPYFDSLTGQWVTPPNSNGPHGRVRYKITPTALIVKWDSVGYFSQQGDKRNNFQLIITDGNDALVPGGNNVAFCYGDMQWTTGSASQGTLGFGGFASTTGINKGDGVNYFQVTRNDQPGAAYDGPYGANDGIDYLDYKAYYFTTCASTNIPPISLTDICDSLTMDMGDDSTVVQYVFIGPEPGQIVNLSMAPNPDVTVLSNVSGVVATITVQVNNTGNRSNNNSNIVITATDNAGSTTTQSTAVIQPTFTRVKEAKADVFSITPNPSKGLFNIHTNTKNTSVRIINLIGEVILNDNTQSDSNLNVDLTNQPNGIYFIQLNNGKETITMKIVKE